MHKLMKIVGYSLATIGFVHIVKHIMHSKEGCCLCGWHKTKEEEKATGETVSHKIKVEDEKPTRETESQKMKGENEEQLGSRYGSNPIRY